MKNKIDILDPSGKGLLEILKYFDPKTRSFSLKKCPFPVETLEAALRVLMIQFGLTSREEVFANLGPIRLELEELKRIAQQFENFKTIVPDPESLAWWYALAKKAGLDEETSAAAARLAVNTWIKDLQKRNSTKTLKELKVAFQKEQTDFKEETAELSRIATNLAPFKTEAARIIKAAFPELDSSEMAALQAKVNEGIETNSIRTTGINLFQQDLHSFLGEKVGPTLSQSESLKESLALTPASLVGEVDQINQAIKKREAALGEKTKPRLINYLPFVRLEPKKGEINLKAMARKIGATPLAMSLRIASRMAPDREENPARSFLLEKGIDQRSIRQKIALLERDQPHSLELILWRRLSAASNSERPQSHKSLENYYRSIELGRSPLKVLELRESFLVKIFSFGKAKTFSGLRTAAWRVFKETKFGGFLSQQAGQFLARFGISKMVGVAVKTGAKGVLAVFPEPVSKALFALSLLWGKIKGKFGGLFKKIGGFLTGFFPFKVKRATEEGLNKIENTFGGALNSIDSFFNGITTFSFPRVIFFLPVAAILVIFFLGGFKLAFQEPRAFVGSWEEEIEVGSRYIEVSKTAHHPGGSDMEIPNSALPFTITYQVTVTAKDSDLFDVRVSDSISLYQGEDGDEREIENRSWTVDHLAQGDSWLSPEYTLEATLDFKDSILDNSVKVEADAEASEEEEISQTFITLVIGTPPVPPSALLAKKIVEKLKPCAGLTRAGCNDDGVIINQASWPAAKKCLIAAGINQDDVINTFTESINKYDELQCVAFVVGASQGDLPWPSGEGSAQNYCSANLSGYTFSTGWDSLRPGDYVVSSQGVFGHVAIIVFKSGAVIRLAEAMGDTGVVQVRPIGRNILEERYCGFLRKD